MRSGSKRVSGLLLLSGTISLSNFAVAQLPSPPSNTPASTAAPGMARILGTVTAIDGHTVTVKSNAGVEQRVVVQDATRILQTAPGQTNLSGATAIHVDDLEVGDRVSARGAMSSDGASLNAVSLIAIKQADLQKKQQADREDWQKRGVSGVVKSVDSATATVTVTTGAGMTAKALAVHAAKTTIIRRYAADSAKLADARPASLDQVKPGDELQARGNRGEDGAEVAAEEIVVGSFRNLAGTITAVDKNVGTISIIDLATKKPYVIRCTADSQLRKLPPMMAQALATKLKGGGGKPVGAASPANATDTSAHTDSLAAPTIAGATSSVARGEGAGGPGSNGAHPGGGPGGPQQMLNRAPVIQFSDLQTGDAVMIVTTEGTAPGAATGSSSTAPGMSTAITLIAGVEPMLQASASGSQNLLSSSWSLGSSGPGGEAAQ